MLLDPLTALQFGVVAALLSAHRLRAAAETEVGRTAWLSAGWSVLYGFSVSWFFFQRPDWFFLYLRPMSSVPLAPAFLGFLVVLGTFGALSGLGAGLLVARGKAWMAFALGLGVLVSILGAYGWQWPQYVSVGSYADFHAGTAVPLDQEQSMGRAFGLSGLVGGGSAALLLGWRFFGGRSRKGTSS